MSSNQPTFGQQLFDTFVTVSRMDLASSLYREATDLIRQGRAQIECGDSLDGLRKVQVGLAKADVADNLIAGIIKEGSHDAA